MIRTFPKIKLTPEQLEETRKSLAEFYGPREKKCLLKDNPPECGSFTCFPIISEYKDFPIKKYENIKVTFSDKEYLETHSKALEKNLTQKIIDNLYESFDNCYALLFNGPKSAVDGFCLFLSVSNYLKWTYLIDWFDPILDKPKQFRQSCASVTRNTHIIWPESVASRLGLAKRGAI